MSDNDWSSYVEDIEDWERPTEQLTERDYRELCGWNQFVRNIRDEFLSYIRSRDYRIMCAYLRNARQFSQLHAVRQQLEMYESYLSGEYKSEFKSLVPEESTT